MEGSSVCPFQFHEEALSAGLIIAFSIIFVVKGVLIHH